MDCYNIQFAFCGEIKGFITGMVRSGDTYTSNGVAELIKEIMPFSAKHAGYVLLFKMDFANVTDGAANKDIPLEVYIFCREDHPNGKECGVETFNKLSLSRNI